MGFDLKKIGLLVFLVIILGGSAGAFKLNEVLSASNQVTANGTLVANNMNINLHANANYGGKLNATGAKTYNIVKKPVHGNLTWNKTSGKFVYTPNKNFVGTDTFTYNVNNGKTNSNTATVQITVTNQAPKAQNISLNISAIANFKGDLNGSDADGDKLTYRIVDKPKHGTLTLTPDGTYIYLQSLGGYVFPQSDSFTYVANDGISDSNIATVNINVQPAPAQTEKQ